MYVPVATGIDLRIETAAALFAERERENEHSIWGILCWEDFGGESVRGWEDVVDFVLMIWGIWGILCRQQRARECRIVKCEWKNKIETWKPEHIIS